MDCSTYHTTIHSALSWDHVRCDEVGTRQPVSLPSRCQMTLTAISVCRTTSLFPPPRQTTVITAETQQWFGGIRFRPTT